MFSSPQSAQQSQLVRNLSVLTTSLLLCLPLVSHAEYIQYPPSKEIQGNAPTASGELQLLFPDGKTAVAAKQRVELTQTPNQFSLSQDTSGLVFSDSDEDDGLSGQLQESNVQWHLDGVLLGEEQMQQPFEDAFAGKTITVDMNATVLATSVTGVPDQGNSPLQQSWALEVPTPERVAVVTWQKTGTGTNTNFITTDIALDQGFPSTGFQGAFFQLRIEKSVDNNQYYHWSSTAPELAAVDEMGIVRFVANFPVGTPTITITATPKTGGGPALEYSFRVKRWFIGSTVGMPYIQVSTNIPMAANFCAEQSILLGADYKIPSYTILTPAIPDGAGRSNIPNREKGVALGTLWGDWGNLGRYTDSSFANNQYWVPEKYNSNTRTVEMGNGTLMSVYQTSSRRTACMVEL